MPRSLKHQMIRIFTDVARRRGVRCNYNSKAVRPTRNWSFESLDWRHKSTIVYRYSNYRKTISGQCRLLKKNDDSETRTLVTAKPLAVFRPLWRASERASVHKRTAKFLSRVHARARYKGRILRPLLLGRRRCDASGGAFLLTWCTCQFPCREISPLQRAALRQERTSALITLADSPCDSRIIM